MSRVSVSRILEGRGSGHKAFLHRLATAGDQSKSRAGVFSVLDALKANVRSYSSIYPSLFSL